MVKMTREAVATILVFLIVGGLAHNETCTTLGLLASNPATSCNEIYQYNIASRQSSGYYWIKTNQGIYQVKCRMGLQCGGEKGGWMQVADVNVAEDGCCPGTWRMITSPRKFCVGGVNAGCNSAYFNTRGVSFQHICGQTKSYQKGWVDAFDHKAGKGIDEVYVDGISITIGQPRQHIWTYASAARDDLHCPCGPTPGPKPSAFVENNYYCESGNNVAVNPSLSAFYLSDPLWDGNNCPANSQCCTQLGMPWFYRKSIAPLNKNIEVRICKDEAHADEDTAIEEMEIFVL